MVYKLSFESSSKGEAIMATLLLGQMCKEESLKAVS